MKVHKPLFGETFDSLIDENIIKYGRIHISIWNDDTLEYEVFKNAGAITVRVEASRDVRSKRGELVGEDDITEVGLDNIKDWDYVIENNSTYEEFRNKVLKLKSVL